MTGAGDEYADTRSGNNNWYGHDGELTWFDWEKLESQHDDYFRFYRCHTNRSTRSFENHRSGVQAVATQTTFGGSAQLFYKGLLDPLSSCIPALCSNIIKFRRSCPLLGRTDFMTDADITWHETNWDDEESRFLAFTYHDRRAKSCASELAMHACPFVCTFLMFRTVCSEPGCLQYTVSLIVCC